MKRETIVNIVRECVSASQVKKMVVKVKNAGIFLECPVTKVKFSLFEIMLCCDNVEKIQREHHFRFKDGSELEIMYDKSGKLEAVVHPSPLK